MNTIKLGKCIVELLMLEAEQRAVFWRFRKKEKYDALFFYKKRFQMSIAPVIGKMLELDEEVGERFLHYFDMLAIAKNMTKEKRKERIKLYVDDLFLIKQNKPPKTIWFSASINKKEHAEFFEKYVLSFF